MRIAISDINEKMLTTPGVHIFDGIAGSAKTSTVVKVLRAAGVDYIHATSTNRLRRDITRRFGGNAYTVAGALFKTVDGHFYDSPREIDAPVVVIDEILQTVPSVFDWIDANALKKSVIVCTDKKQMLAPTIGAACLRRFRQASAQYGIYTLDHSYRPVDAATAEEYMRGYAAESDGTDLFQTLSKAVPHISADKVEYKSSDAYICHTNAAESGIYARYHLSDRYDLSLIPKGSIASKEVSDIRRYPIVSQEMAQRMGSNAKYFQISNVGSVVRFQGSEVLPGEKCYFYVPRYARVSNRECYTMLTRCKTIDSIVIVECEDIHDVAAPRYYAGLPVLPSKWLVRDDMTADTDEKEKTAALRSANATAAGVYYKGILSKGKCITTKKYDKPPAGVTISGLLKKQPEIALTTPNLFYKTVDARTHAGRITSPQNFDHKIVREYNRLDTYPYILDVYAAYPHAWHNAKMIDGRTYRTDDSGGIRMYITTSDTYGYRGQLITGDLYDIYKDMPGFNAAMIGSFDGCTRTYIGDYLYTQAHDTVEAKEGLHGIHYGLLQRDYLEPVKYKDDAPTAYIINDKNVYLPVMACIQSEICRVMAVCKTRIYGNPGAGKTVIDGLYFKTTEDITALGDSLRDLLPGYDFRIVANEGKKRTSEKPILYKTYADLPTKKEKAKEKRKKRGKRYD